jgi:hypothetical protein
MNLIAYVDIGVGRGTIHLQQPQAIALVADWGKQRCGWKELIAISVQS